MAEPMGFRQPPQPPYRYPDGRQPPSPSLNSAYSGGPPYHSSLLPHSRDHEDIRRLPPHPDELRPPSRTSSASGPRNLHEFPETGRERAVSHRNPSNSLSSPKVKREPMDEDWNVSSSRPPINSLAPRPPSVASFHSHHEPSRPPSSQDHPNARHASSSSHNHSQAPPTAKPMLPPITTSSSPRLSYSLGYSNRTPAVHSPHIGQLPTNMNSSPRVASNPPLRTSSSNSLHQRVPSNPENTYRGTPSVMNVWAHLAANGLRDLQPRSVTRPSSPSMNREYTLVSLF